MFSEKQKIEKARIVKKVDLVSDFGVNIYLIEIPDNNLENWFVTNVSSNPHFIRPAWHPLKDEAIMVKKGYGEGWYTRLLLVDETRQPLLIERIDNINLSDPLHPLGISLKESMRRGLI
jgi:hypothetical protein